MVTLNHQHLRPFTNDVIMVILNHQDFTPVNNNIIMVELPSSHTC